MFLLLISKSTPLATFTSKPLPVFILDGTSFFLFEILNNMKFNTYWCFVCSLVLSISSYQLLCSSLVFCLSSYFVWISIIFYKWNLNKSCSSSFFVSWLERCVFCYGKVIPSKACSSWNLMRLLPIRLVSEDIKCMCMFLTLKVTPLHTLTFSSYLTFFGLFFFSTHDPTYTLLIAMDHLLINLEFVYLAVRTLFFSNQLLCPSPLGILVNKLPKLLPLHLPL